MTALPLLNVLENSSVWLVSLDHSEGGNGWSTGTTSQISRFAGFIWISSLSCMNLWFVWVEQFRLISRSALWATMVVVHLSGHCSTCSRATYSQNAFFAIDEAMCWALLAIRWEKCGTGELRTARCDYKWFPCTPSDVGYLTYDLVSVCSL